MCVLLPLTVSPGRRKAWGMLSPSTVYLSTVRRPPSLSSHLAGWKACSTAVCRLRSNSFIRSPFV